MVWEQFIGGTTSHVYRQKGNNPYLGIHKRKVLGNVGEDLVKDTVHRGRVLINE